MPIHAEGDTATGVGEEGKGRPVWPILEGSKPGGGGVSVYVFAEATKVTSVIAVISF